MKGESIHISDALTAFMREKFVGQFITLKASNYMKVRKPLKVVEISELDYAEYSDTPEWEFTFEGGRVETVGTWDTVILCPQQ